MKKSIEITAVIIMAFCFNMFCIAQQRAEQIVEQIIKEKKIPGFAFIISKKGEIINEGYYGLANLELDKEVNEKSVFAIASMSKTYTATAILLLAEKGRLNLNDSVKKYIPEAPNTWNRITIKHLLNHSSGLVDDWALYSWDKSNEFFLKTQTDSSFLQHLFDQKLLFDPGTSHSYSCGPFVLGIIIEKITGLYYEEYLKSNIFTPLALNETYVDHPYKLIPNRVSGYLFHDTAKMNTGVSGISNGISISPVSYGRADVGICTTARDLINLYNALLSGKILNEESMKIMFNPSTLNNGDLIPTAPGWMNWPLAGNLISEHSGGFRTGFSSQAFVIPQDKIVIIILTNLQGAGVNNFVLAQKLAAIYKPEFLQLSERTKQEDNNPELTRQHLGLFKSIASDTINKNLVNSNFPKSYYSNRLKKSISSAESILFLDEDNVADKNLELFGQRIYTLRWYKLIMKRELFITISLDKNGKVIFIDYPETD